MLDEVWVRSGLDYVVVSEQDNGGKDLYGAVVKGCSTTKIGSGAMRHKKGLR